MRMMPFLTLLTHDIYYSHCEAFAWSHQKKVYNACWGTILPLVTAVIHIAFAFKVITKMLVVLNLTNVQLYAGCTAVTILVFAVFYVIVYALTARTYYHIVS